MSNANQTAINKAQFPELEPIAKANLALADLQSGGALLAEQAERFYTGAIKGRKLLPMITFKMMKSDSYKIPSLQFAGQVMYGGESDAALPEGNQSKPTLGERTISAKLLKGEIPIPDEVLEDNVELEGLRDTIEAEAQKAVGRDIERAAIQGDTTSSNTLLKQFDGFLKLASAHLVDYNPAKFLSSDEMSEIFVAMPQEYREEQTGMVFLMSQDARVRYVRSLGDRAGDRALGYVVEGFKGPTWGGVPVHDIPLIPQGVTFGGSNATTEVLFCDPKNMVFGAKRDVKMEAARDARAGRTNIVISTRVGCNFAWIDSVVKARGIKY